MSAEQLIPDDLRRTLLLSIKVCMGYKPKETAQWMHKMEHAQREASVARAALPPGTYWVQLFAKGRRQPTAVGAPRQLQVEAGARLEVDWPL